MSAAFGVTLAILAIIVIVIVRLLPVVSFLSGPNTRTFIKDGIHITASRNPTGTEKSGFVYLTTPEINREVMKDSEVTAIWVRIDGKSEVELLTASPEALQSAGFRITENRVERVNPWGGGRVELRTNLSGNWMTFPIDEKEARQLFGTPDSEQDTFGW